MANAVLSPPTLVQQAALGILAERGPLEAEELAEVLVGVGLVLGSDPEDYLGVTRSEPAT